MGQKIAPMLLQQLPGTFEISLLSANLSIFFITKSELKLWDFEVFSASMLVSLLKKTSTGLTLDFFDFFPNNIFPKITDAKLRARLICKTTMAYLQVFIVHVVLPCHNLP